MTVAQQIPEAIDDFLSTLVDADRELMLDVIEHATSSLEVWTLAVVLGYRGGYGELEEFAESMAPRTDRRALLIEEAKNLKNDIVNARRGVELMTVDPEKGCMRIAALSKELRGHLVEADKMSRAVDRKGLILAGAERVMRELRAIFRGQPDMEEALTQAFKTVWAMLTEER
ncbi:MAG: hypothetical protein VKI63_06160 [Cyanobium sp.]|nr:hypothetical protein [Cyanobium sp.]